MKSAVVNGLFAGLLPVNTAFAADPLPSWNDGPAKQSTAICGVRPRNRASVFHTAASSAGITPILDAQNRTPTEFSRELAKAVQSLPR